MWVNVISLGKSTLRLRRASGASFEITQAVATYDVTVLIGAGLDNRSRVGGVPEVVDDGVQGYLVPPREVKTMAARTLDILGSPERRAQMGEAARKRALDKYCASKIIPLYEKLYQRLLAEKHA